MIQTGMLTSDLKERIVCLCVVLYNCWKAQIWWGRDKRNDCVDVDATAAVLPKWSCYAVFEVDIFINMIVPRKNIWMCVCSQFSVSCIWHIERWISKCLYVCHICRWNCRKNYYLHCKHNTMKWSVRWYDETQLHSLTHRWFVPIFTEKKIIYFFCIHIIYFVHTPGLMFRCSACVFVSVCVCVRIGAFDNMGMWQQLLSHVIKLVNFM